MNRGQIEFWKETVGPKDEVCVFGDFAMGWIRVTQAWFRYYTDGNRGA